MLVQDVDIHKETRIYAARSFKREGGERNNPKDWKVVSAAVTATVEGQEVKFSAPAHAALCLNISNQAYKKLQAISINDLFKNTSYGRAAEEGLPLLFDFFELSFQNIVFAYTALEAFANQTIPDDFVFTKLRQDKRCEESFSKDQIERYLSLDIKLSEVLPQITGTPLSKGASPWTEYAELRKIRDRIIHVKSVDVGVGDRSVESIWAELLKRRNTDSSLIAHIVISHFPQNSDDSSPVAKGRNIWIKAFPY